MKKIFLFMALVLVTSLVLGACSSNENAAAETEYNYISAEDVKSKIENNESMMLVDIQPEDQYDNHHIVGTIPTFAYPSKAEEDHAKLLPLVEELNASEDPIVIVCPGGGSGAKGTVDYYLEQGVAAERLLILENGQKEWPYDELLEK